MPPAAAGAARPPAAGAPLLRVQGLSSASAAVAVKDLSFDVAAGEILGLIGPNGAGKSTVFNLVAARWRPRRGQRRR